MSAADAVIRYDRERTIQVEAFVDLLERSGLAGRRPVDDEACLRGMVEHADLLITARLDGRLVGIARSVTDFHYCCYLSDLAVDRALQRQGIGKRLIAETRQWLGPRTRLILLSAPAARAYYPKIGFERHPDAFVTPLTGDPVEGDPSAPPREGC